MRRQRWLANLLIMGTLLASAGGVSAQNMAPPGAAAGPPQRPVYGGNPAADFSSYPPPEGGYPSYYQPWPATSPYEHEFSQLNHRDGLWEHDTQSRVGLPARWKFRTEYLFIETDAGRSLIGNDLAPTYREQIIPVLTADGDDDGDLADYAEALEGVNNSGVGFNLFDPVHAKDIDKPDGPGVRLTLENFNPDGSGMQFWGMWADADASFNAFTERVNNTRGTERAFLERILDDPDLLDDPPQPNQPDPAEVLQNNLLNLAGIPLDDGTITTLPDGTTFGGASAVFDLDFLLETEVDVYGTGLRWNSTAFYDTDTVRIRTNAGLRYMFVQERFGFLGRDSGLLFTAGDTDTVIPDLKVNSVPNGFDDNADGIVDNAGLIEDDFGDGGGGGGGGGDGDGGTDNFFFLNDPELFPITSILNNEVDSHLGGPEIGLNYDVGGENFRIGGSTNVGLLFNYHRIDLSGDNIFVTTRQADLIQPTPTNARPNRFSSDSSHTSVSPLFEQSVYAEGPLFRYVPLLRRSSIFRNATFRLGYTLTWIGELTRASDSIVWQGNPSEGLFPQIKTSRSTWRAESVDLGVTWKW